MVKPSIEDLAINGKLNRYELAIATAKCARIITDDYVAKRAAAEKLIANKETDKSLAAILKIDASDEKAVKTAINGIYNGDFVVDKEYN